MKVSTRHRIAPFYRSLFRALRTRGEGFRALILHHVDEREIPALEALLDYVSEEYGFISPAEAEMFLSGSALPGRDSTPHLLTFDDGFRSNFGIATTLLDSRDIRALFFVCPGLLDAPAADQSRVVAENVFPDGAGRPVAGIPELMKWSDVAALHSMGHTIGSHSFLHRRLSTLTLQEVEDDVSRSAKRLQEELGAEPRWFAYPFGDVDSVTGEALLTISRHFQFCCSGVRGLNGPETHRCAIVREAIDLGSPREYQKLTADGGLAPLYGSRRRRLNGMAATIPS